MKVALVCGEASGDQLGAGLARALLAREPGISLCGVTGPAMRAAGVSEWLDCSVFSVMGYWSALKRLPRLLAARRKLLALLARERPQVLVGIDAPDLNLSLAARCKQLQVRYVQYVCPSFWAWRGQRKEVLASACDHVLLILPFEQKLCADAGISATYVGHRLTNAISSGEEARAAARAKLGVAGDAKLLALLPGSRGQELKAHVGLFVETARLCQQQLPGLQIAWAPRVAADLASVPDATLHPGQARTLLQAADAALVKSGTVTLEALLAGCPQVITYRLPGISGYLVKRKLGDLSAKLFGLPNLIAEERIVPELIQEQATAANLAQELKLLLHAGGASSQREAYARVRARLATRIEPDAAAAAAVLAVAAS